MSLSDFIYAKLKDVAKTVPIAAPIETELPLITYSLDGQEIEKTTNGGGVAQNFVTITVYDTEYDKVNILADQIRSVLGCVMETEQNIIGVNYTSSSNGYDSEPVKRYFVTLEYNIYERF